MSVVGDGRFILPGWDFNAQYPDYNRFIPRGTTVATGDREAIKQALTPCIHSLQRKISRCTLQLEDTN